ncbi:leucine-rich repeat-containing protein 4C [Nematostella vectensis]|uniref:leucine-rich repeat-containing protein 4C n=1 Tax=Nematostella vectensis TaxID=45351 RepID=UPI002076D9CB|nr:leucine-rich repeat-containing protein 4C [Nematostella vectensis]
MIAKRPLSIYVILLIMTAAVTSLPVYCPEAGSYTAPGGYPECRVLNNVTHHVTLKCFLCRLEDLRNLTMNGTTVKHLDLSRNKLMIVKTNSFWMMKQLTYLSLATSGIRSIEKGAFTGLDHLVEL